MPTCTSSTTTALQGDIQVRHGKRLAHCAVCSRQHFVDRGNGGVDRLLRAAQFLYDERHDCLACLHTLGNEHGAHLIRLAAKPDDENAGEIRMPHIAADRAAQLLDAFAVVVDARYGLFRHCLVRPGRVRPLLDH